MAEKGSIQTQRDVFSSDPTVNAIRYKPSEHSNEQAGCNDALYIRQKFGDRLTQGSYPIRKVFCTLRQIDQHAYTVQKHAGWTLCGFIEAVQNHIERKQKDSRPIHSLPYRAGAKAREFEKRETSQILVMDNIEPGQMEWASPVSFAREKDWNPRVCSDYLKLNAVKIKDSYSILCLNESIDLLEEATIFSTLDANSGYRQV